VCNVNVCPLVEPSWQKDCDGRIRDAKAQDSACCPQAVDKGNLSGHLCECVCVLGCVCVLCVPGLQMPKDEEWAGIRIRHVCPLIMLWALGGQ